MKIVVSLPEDLLLEFDELIKGAYGSRSEAIREAMRSQIEDLRKRQRYKGLAEGATKEET